MAHKTKASREQASHAISSGLDIQIPTVNSFRQQQRCKPSGSSPNVVSGTGSPACRDADEESLQWLSEVLNDKIVTMTRCKYFLATGAQFYYPSRTGVTIL